MIRQYDEDLFQSSTMTFGEHLEELRRCLFMAVLGLMVGCAIGLAMGRWVVQFIQTPLSRALTTFYLEESQQRAKTSQERSLVEEKLVLEEQWVPAAELIAALRDYLPPFDGPQWQNPPGHPMSLEGPRLLLPTDLIDPDDFRKRQSALARGDGSEAQRAVWQRLTDRERQALADAPAEVALLAPWNRLISDARLDELPQLAALRLTDQGQQLWARRDSLTTFERQRLNRLLLEAAFPADLRPTRSGMVRLALFRYPADDPRIRTQSLGTTETFGIYMKASFLVGAVISSPWVFWWLWSFVAAGLYPHEKRYVYVFLPFSLGLFLAGAGLAFFFVFDPVLNFLLSFNRWLGIDPDPRISEWLNFVLLLPLGFGVSFQLPLVMLFLERIGIFDARSYLEKWKIAILAIAVISAALTPSGDPYAMTLMGIPLVLLYMGGVLLCWYMPRLSSYEPSRRDDVLVR